MFIICFSLQILFDLRKRGFPMPETRRAYNIQQFANFHVAHIHQSFCDSSATTKHMVLRKGSRCITALDVGGKNGNKLRRKRLPLQGILRDGSQGFSLRFPYPVYCNADASLYVENTGVIVFGNRRVQPPFGKRYPGWLPCRQIDRIRNVKKASAFRR